MDAVALQVQFPGTNQVSSSLSATEVATMLASSVITQQSMIRSIDQSGMPQDQWEKVDQCRCGRQQFPGCQRVFF